MRSHLLRQSRRLFCSSLKQESAAANTVDATTSQVNPVLTYNRGIQVLHWSMAGGLIANIMIAHGTRALPLSYADQKSKMIELHGQIGVVLLGLALLRFGVRFSSKMPAKLPLSPPMRIVNVAKEHTFYALMLGLPVSGLMYNHTLGKAAPFCPTVPTDEQASEAAEHAGLAFNIHRSLAGLMTLMIPLHMGAVIKQAKGGHKVFSRITSSTLPK